MVGLEAIAEPSNALVDIVLVHGWCGNQQPWTFVSGGQSIFWPEVFLRHDISQARILTFGYDANVGRFWNLEPEIDRISMDLIRSLKKKRTTPDMKRRPIIFIAHSIGGLVCEGALVRASNGLKVEKELANCVRNIAFLGTPFFEDAEQWSKAGEKFFKLSGTKPGNDLKGMSQELAALRKDFLDLLKSRSKIPAPIEVICFYEGSPTELDGEKTTIVEKFATTIPGFPLPARLDGNHQDMCAFKSRDRNYDQVYEQLLDWVGELAEQTNGESQMGAVSANVHGTNYGFNLGHNTGTITNYAGRNQ